MPLFTHLIDTNTHLFRDDRCLHRRSQRKSDRPPNLAHGRDQCPTKTRILGRQRFRNKERQNREDSICTAHAEHHCREAVRPVCCMLRDWDGEEKRGHANRERAEDKYEIAAYMRQNEARHCCNHDSRHTIGDEAQRSLNDGQALKVLEPVRRENEVVVEAAEEQGHQHIRPRELPIFENAHLHERPFRGFGLEVVLPEAEGDNNEQADHD